MSERYFTCIRLVTDSKVLTVGCARFYKLRRVLCAPTGDRSQSGLIAVRVNELRNVCDPARSTGLRELACEKQTQSPGKDGTLAVALHQYTELT